MITREERLRQGHLYRWAWLAVLTAGLMLLFLIQPARGDDGSSNVYYQVTYADGQIKNTPAPPTTNQGILMVTRTISYNSQLPGYETVSTGNQPVEELNPQRSKQTQLKWDGKAWVDAVEPRQSKRPADATPPSNGNAGAGANTLPVLVNFTRSLVTAYKSLEQAEAKLSAGQSADDDLANAKQALQQAAAMQDELARAFQGHRRPAETSPDQTGQTGPPPVLRSSASYAGPLDYYPGVDGCDWPIAGAASATTERPNPDYDTGPRVIIREQD